jgi:predicted permease
MIGDLFQDLRHGLRRLRRSPGFAALIVVTLGLGIGANAAIFRLIDAVLLQPLPVADPGQLVLLCAGRASGRGVGQPWTQGDRLAGYSHPLYEQLRAQGAALFDGLAAEDSMTTIALVGSTSATGDDADDRAAGRAVSANYFSVLGVSAAAGRMLLPTDESAPGANPVLVLSHAYWQRRFGGSGTAIGGRLAVNGSAYTVVGVAAPGFIGTKIGEPTDFWVPLTMQGELRREPSLLRVRNQWWLRLVGRLAPGVSTASAEAAANLILRRYLGDDQFAPTRQRVRIGLEPGAHGFSGPRDGARDPLLVLMAAAGMLLLIVCLNASHLLLARSVHRQRELSIRTALGASRLRLLRQLLSEGLLLAALGAAAGALAAGWLGDGLLALAGKSPVGLGSTADVHVASFIGTLALATAAMLGVVPAWQAARAGVLGGPRSGGPAVAGGGSSHSITRLLLTLQVAFSIVLLVGAGLLTTTLARLRDTEKGFDEAHLLLVGLDSRMAARRPAAAMYDQILRRIEALPGVRKASLSTYGVLGGMEMTESILLPAAASQPVLVNIVTPGYFETLGIDTLAGRGFLRTDHQGAPPVAVVNRAWARRFFSSTDVTQVLGERFTFDPVKAPEMPTEAFEVVGVARNAKTGNLRYAAQPTVYLAAAQAPGFLLGTLEVRASGEPALLAGQVRRTVREAVPDLPVTSVITTRSQVRQSLGQERLLATLASAFGLAALFLVCIGLYGVISQWAAHRTREIGVRMALGATTTAVRWLILRQAFALIIAGVLVGLPLAMVSMRLLEHLLYGLGPMDLTTLTVAALTIFAVATMAAYLPARRASGVDPMMALRYE